MKPEIEWAWKAGEALTGISKETVHPLLRIELCKKAMFALEARAIEAEHWRVAFAGWGALVQEAIGKRAAELRRMVREVREGE